MLVEVGERLVLLVSCDMKCMSFVVFVCDSVFGVLGGIGYCMMLLRVEVV